MLNKSVVSPRVRSIGREPMKSLIVSLFIAGLCVSTSSYANDDDKSARDAFRVCADGNYMPMSNREQEGYENQIASLLADELGLQVEYYWFPQRLGFIRNTLRKKDPSSGKYFCDVVMGVPDGYELTITTQPYMQSTYALVFLKGQGFDDIQTQDDFLNLPAERKSSLRIGAHERNPGVQLMAENDMFTQLVPYVAQGGDPDVAPAQQERDDLLDGKIDMAILWGPLAAQLRNSSDVDVAVVALESTPTVRFHYPFSMGVRHPDREWRDQLKELIAVKQPQIDKILGEFGIPLVDENGRLIN